MLCKSRTLSTNVSNAQYTRELFIEDLSINYIKRANVFNSSSFGLFKRWAKRCVWGKQMQILNSAFCKEKKFSTQRGGEGERREQVSRSDSTSTLLAQYDTLHGYVSFTLHGYLKLILSYKMLNSKQVQGGFQLLSNVQLQAKNQKWNKGM